MIVGSRNAIALIVAVLFAQECVNVAAFSPAIHHCRPPIVLARERECSPSLQMSFTDDDTEDQVSSAKESEKAPKAPPVKCPDCDLCDGSGRIEGGIGLVLKWWPIKAYRPCPNFIDRGGFYQRSGQGLDEIAFGRDSTFDVEK